MSQKPCPRCTTQCQLTGEECLGFLYPSPPYPELFTCNVCESHYAQPFGPLGRLVFVPRAKLRHYERTATTS